MSSVPSTMRAWLMTLLTVTYSLCSDLEPVQKLALTSAKSTAIRVSWSAPSAAVLASVQGYRICAAPRDGAPNCVDIRNAYIGGHVVSKLLPCEEYNISVVVLGKDNSKSEAARLSASTAPGPASDLVVARESGEMITASWSYPRSAAARCADKLKLTWCGGEGSSSGCSVARMPVAAAETAYYQQLQGVQYCGRYSVRLAVLDRALQSSDELVAVLEEYPLEGPQNMRVTNYTSSSILLAWDTPEGQRACDYHVFVDVTFIEKSTMKSVETVFNSGQTSYTVNEAAPCKAYNITVRFGTTTENKNASITAYTLPQGNTIFNNASIENQTSSSVTVVWAISPENHECVTSFSICWGENNTTIRCHSTTDDDYVITGLEPATDYRVSVEARLGNGFQLESKQLTAATSSRASELSSCSTTKICMLLSILICISEEIYKNNR